jgi:hypothetical protein
MASQENLIYAYIERRYDYPGRSILSDPSVHIPPQQTSTVP